MKGKVSMFLGTVAGVAMALAAQAAAQQAPAPAPEQHMQRPPSPWHTTEGDYSIPNVHFRSGETLPSLRIHYSTLGTPKRDASGHITNAIMLLHGTGGTGKGFASASFGNQVYGPGQVFDITKYFILLPDDIGHGGSSKPSDGMKASFPKYDYADMVDAEHALADHLGIQKFVLIGGHSMGCMHSFMWSEMYPDAVSHILPLACTPTAIAGRNRMFRKMIIESIRSDPAYMDGNYTTEPLYGLREAQFVETFSVTSPGSLQRQYPTREAVDAHVDQMVKSTPRTDANDMIWMFDASRDYNPEPDLGKIKAKILWINSMDDFVNAPDAGEVPRMHAKFRPDQYRMIPTGPETNGHGTTMKPQFWTAWVGDFLKS
jgi:homoserine O-acetyltransferase